MSSDEKCRRDCQNLCIGECTVIAIDEVVQDIVIFLPFLTPAFDMPSDEVLHIGQFIANSHGLFLRANPVACTSGIGLCPAFNIGVALTRDTEKVGNDGNRQRNSQLLHNFHVAVTQEASEKLFDDAFYVPLELRHPRFGESQVQD
ncbi:hypothetical protein FQZ97_788570 [compost metagenome]